MTMDALISWNLPTTRESGLPLDPLDIAGVEVWLSADLGDNFTVLSTVPTADTELGVPDLEPGDWIARLVVIDTADRRSDNVDAPFNVPDNSPPGAVTNVQISLS